MGNICPRSVIYVSLLETNIFMLLFQPNVNLEKEMPAAVQTASNAMKEKETVMLIHSVLETLFVAQIIVDCGIQMLKLTLTVVNV